ncbi:MAG: hypothetical protein JSV37_07370 [Anaerolineaceae bacterium]|nr:MAG: hypothetical protein JSV37_07370 [Anaerolineaceae bacterium]
MSFQERALHIGDCAYRDGGSRVDGEFVPLLGEQYYRIRNYDRMDPFFMSIVSNSDHWLFISSTGGLTCGRRNADSALFPYDTDDKIAASSGETGHKAVLLVTKGDHTYLWEPFSERYAGVYRVQRNLYKNVYGDKLIFEETNRDLGLTYRYAWRTSDRYGFVKTAWLKDESGDGCSVALIDGLQNILPYGTNVQLQRIYSNLLNAYKRNELEMETGLGIFALSSSMTDLAEPSEALRATTVWQTGLDNACYLLSSYQFAAFERGGEITQETDVRGHPGAYLVHAEFDLTSAEEREWYIVAEINQDHASIVSLNNLLRSDKTELKALLEKDIERDTKDLVSIVASADGLQVSGDRLSTAHHYANTLFNTMRGGIFADNYTINKTDLLDFVRVRNRPVLEACKEFFEALPEELDANELLTRAAGTGHSDLERLSYQYLPLTFSRRHGDPSRPWNQFSINVKKPDGTRELDYQGNWRDIFQNWEPLAHCYPEFVESMICSFVCATTADGYNPYRVTRDGIEWEKPDPDSAWANIGYWSDHQIIYLQKLLEISDKFHPGKLHALLPHKIFSHANVPYRIKPYSMLLEDWYDTIVFDDVLDGQIDAIVAEMGTDGKLVLDAEGQVLHVNLAEKLLILLLAKLSNFVPGGGIWMNTQRPEWNDANNALTGKGLSVVTLGYLRRFVVFLQKLISRYDEASLEVTQEVKAAFDAMYEVLQGHKSALQASFDDQQRRAVMDALGQVGNDYRQGFYKNGFSEAFTDLDREELLGFMGLAQQYIEHTLRENRRKDSLYHAYNILQVDEDSASVGHLYEMLEGQVAILSSGLLSAEESLTLLRSLRQSALYRADQHSYILYPDRDLPGFLSKNLLHPSQVKKSALLTRLIDIGDHTLIVRDENGMCHFSGGFRNVKDAKRALVNLREREEYSNLVDAEYDSILELFEEVFDHASFTGRSGTFFAYEGLGSIYWHMVSKLLLAVQETLLHAHTQGESSSTIQALIDIYYDIRSGIGFNKTPEVYGAFPTDPYSHTPAGQGAKQPGMTGQVKEELLARIAELGAFVEQGVLSFDTLMLRESEFTTQETTFNYIDVNGREQSIELPPRALAYTFCQVPIVYICSDDDRVDVAYSNGSQHQATGHCLDVETSERVFRRDGRVERIAVYLKFEM